MAGSSSTNRDEQNLIMRKHMLDYVIFLLEHGSDFSGFAAKAIHAVLLCRMEQGAIKNFSEIEKRKEYVEQMQKNILKLKMQQNNQQTRKTSMVCTYFSQDTCVHNKTHETKNVLYRHVC